VRNKDTVFDSNPTSLRYNTIKNNTYIWQFYTKASDRQMTDISHFYPASFVGRQYHQIFRTHERHKMLELADRDATSLLTNVF